MIKENIDRILQELPKDVVLVAVSKTKPISFIEEAYAAGQRVFGENRVPEMVEKHKQLPKDISWHMIGHLQRNKVKNIVGFVDLIHGVDSIRLLEEINKEAKKIDRIVNVLIQIHIAKEETKHGFAVDEAQELFTNSTLKRYENVRIKGLMGMATFTDNESVINDEFSELSALFSSLKENSTVDLEILSMGMSGDYEIAIKNGSTMVRIGSSIFGNRL